MKTEQATVNQEMGRNEELADFDYPGEVCGCPSFFKL
jgi:hypothetical protein